MEDNKQTDRKTENLIVVGCKAKDISKGIDYIKTAYLLSVGNISNGLSVPNKNAVLIHNIGGENGSGKH